VVLVIGGLFFSLGAFYKKLFSRWILALIFTSSIISFCAGYFELHENFYVVANLFRNTGFFSIGLSIFRKKDSAALS
jgi:hypothetical protein